MTKKILDEVLDIAVLVPSLGQWDVQFGRSLTALFRKTSSWRPDPSLGCKSLRLRLYTKQSSMLVANRQYLIARAMKDGCSHMLFIDADMAFPETALIDLLMRGKKVIAANCTNRSFPVNFVAVDLEGNNLDSRKKFGVQRVQHSGCAMFLIHRSVVEKMSVPLFMMEWIPDMNDFCGEDVYFCAKIQAEANEEIWVDHDLSKRMGHVGRLTFHPGLIGTELPEYSKENMG